MERRDFIRSCGYACLSGVSLMTVFQSCASTHVISGTIEGEDLVIDLADFKAEKEISGFRKYLLVQNESLKFPICVSRFSDTDYSAVYLQCSHQGAGLQVFGDKIQCPAHGSEFTNRGIVENGPAATNLRTFSTRIEAGSLKIALK